MKDNHDASTQNQSTVSNVQSEKIAGMLFPGIDKTPEYYEKLYPPRHCDTVTRFAPSPTGFLHIGGLFAALVSYRTAQQKNGTFFLRVEDTDKKREVEDGVNKILTGLKSFGIDFDEGYDCNGAYGPYLQSERTEIYQTFAKQMVKAGLAYPCFCTPEQLEETRHTQESQKITTGYYGEWAVHRNITMEEIEHNLSCGKPFVLRLKSSGNEHSRVSFDDLIKGHIEMPENNQDIVLLKADGTPTYHFAHAVDDHLMRTTHVIRGDEWISSTPIHLQLFGMLEKILHQTVFDKPVYAHISPIMKLDDGGKRKLSKRKDPEAAVEYYSIAGYPSESVVEYLLTLANSNFEQWRMENQQKAHIEFKLELDKMSVSGALFDIAKLNDVSKNVIGVMTSQQVYDKCVQWATLQDENLYNLLISDADYAKRIFAIEREIAKPRKDIAKWSDVPHYVQYFYDQLFNVDESLFEDMNIASKDISSILTEYSRIYNPDDDKDTWFNKIRELSERLGFCANVKTYKKNPMAYKGHVGDVSTIIRLAVTGRRNTPDLYEILRLLGKQRVLERLTLEVKCNT